MRWYKHWKWQCLLAAPLLPWFYIQWTTWIYDTMIALGWTHGKMDGPIVAIVILTVGATIVFIIGYCTIFDDITRARREAEKKEQSRGVS